MVKQYRTADLLLLIGDGNGMLPEEAGLPVVGGAPLPVEALVHEGMAG
jgi:hypothetical protein